MRTLLALVALTSAGICRADGPTDEVMTEARRHFQAGVNLLDDPDGARYEDAYLAFRKAFELSRSPKVLGNIGFCALKLERDGEAVAAYSAYLREARDIDDRERAQIERDLATLGSTAARLKVVVRGTGTSFVVVDTRVQTRGANVVNAYPFTGHEATLQLRPGRHSVKVKGEDGESVVYDTTVEPASYATHEFTFPPPIAPVTVYETARARASYAGPILVGTLGIAAIGTGIVTGLLAKDKTNQIASRCPQDICPSSYDFHADRREAKSLATVADGAFIGGGVVLGGALLWALLTPRGSAPRPPQTGRAAWLSGVQCSSRGCDAQVGGTF